MMRLIAAALGLLKRTKREDLVTISITAEEVYKWYEDLHWQEDRSTREIWHDDKNPCPITAALWHELPKAKSITVDYAHILIEDMRFPTTDKLLSWISAIHEGADIDGIRLTIGYNEEGNPEADIATYLEEA